MLLEATRATRRMPFLPRSVDEAERTVELTASTGAGVPREDFDGRFLEVLSLERGAVDLSRVEGMPLLDSHRQDGLERVLGVVRSARLADGQLVVTVQLSERAEGVWRDVVSGIIRNVSVGYSIENFVDGSDRETGQRVRTVTRWMLHEVSLVPVGADAGAKTRGQTMPNTNPNAPAAHPPVPATPPAAIVTPPAPVVTRAAINQEIRALAETFSLGADFVNGLIDREATIEDARTAAIDQVRKAATRPGPQAHVTVIANHDDPEAFRTRAGEALFARYHPRHKLSDPARPFVNMTTLDLARHCLQLRGLQTTGLSPAETIQRALHTTSDFPLIFADTANRSLRTAYEAAPATLKAVARQTTAKDFRAKTAIQLGEAPTLEKVNEHGEYKYGTMAEAAESYRIDTFGRIIGLTRKAIVNDDLGAFTDLAGKFGVAAAEFEAQFLVDLLERNGGLGPAMSDNLELFNAAHGNLPADADAPTIESLSVARTAMRKQTGLGGKPINVPPRFLLVPPDLETTGEMILANLQPTTTADVNPFGGKLDLLVEARLSSALRWYLIGDPTRIEGLEYAYLAGEEGPQIETRAGFEIDGVETKVRLDFGAAFLDWRGWFMNEGEEAS